MLAGIPVSKLDAATASPKTGSKSAMTAMIWTLMPVPNGVSLHAAVMASCTMALKSAMMPMKTGATIV
jgi:hypothetical protein